MPVLNAVYDIALPSHLRVKCADNDKLCYSSAISEFQVEVTLVIDESGGWSKGPNDVIPTRYVRRMKITVSRELDSEPPEIQITDQGNRDFSRRVSWFEQHTKGYDETAVTAANRVVKFFRYIILCPYLYEYSGHEQEFNSPEWINSRGEKIHPGILLFNANIHRAMLGEVDFTIDKTNDFMGALADDICIENYQEFLSDAQTSILSDKLTRGILELAIACEIAVKQVYSKQSKISDPVIRYLNDEKSDRNFIGLLHKDAKDTFGESFKETSNSDYNNIDYLFRTRNKVAHRGELFYNDDQGIRYNVDHDMIHQWYQSVLILMRWLEKYE